MDMKKRSEPNFYEELVESSLYNLSSDYRQNNFLFKNEECDLVLDYKEFYECKFEKVTFLNHIRRAMFTDVIFENCDFSNIDMHECVFRRVIFNKCRLTGIDLTQGTFESVLIQNSLGQYANFSSSKIKESSFVENIFRDSAFTMCKFSHVEIEQCDFNKAEFNDTKLAGLDFSTSDISNVMFDVNRLQGITLNEEQALACAKLLGINVKQQY